MEGRVIVRRCSLELCRTGIDHLITREDAVGNAHRTHLIWRLSRNLCDGAVGKSDIFGCHEQARREALLRQAQLDIRDVLDFMQEPFIDFRDIVNGVDISNAAT